MNAVLDQLARTKGWTMFIGVLLWIAAVLLILLGVGVVVFGLIGGSSMFPGTPEMGQFTGGAIGATVLGALYIVMALFYIYPAQKLCKFSRMVGDLLNAPSEQGLADALNEQRAFWKFSGIMAIILIAFYVLIIVGSIIVGLIGFTSTQTVVP